MGTAEEGKFNVGVAAVIENPREEILLVRRSVLCDYEPGMWEIVCGRMRQFEEPEKAVQREVCEETGLAVAVVKFLRVAHFFRGEKKMENELILLIFYCRSKSSDVFLSSEHGEFRWLAPKDALLLTGHPGVKKDIQAFMLEKVCSSRKLARSSAGRH